MLNEFIIPLCKLIGIIFDPLVLIILSLIIAIYLTLKFSEKEGLFFAMNMFVGIAVIVLLKNLIKRARPLTALIQETSYSFPSGHATISIIFFGSIAYLISRKCKSTKLKWLVSTLAITFTGLIGFTRLILKVHWTSDVIGGFLIGGFILMMSIFIFKKRI